MDDYSFKCNACYFFFFLCGGAMFVLLSGKCFCSASNGQIYLIIFLQYTLYLPAHMPDFHS